MQKVCGTVLLLSSIFEIPQQIGQYGTYKIRLADFQGKVNLLDALTMTIA